MFTELNRKYGVTAEIAALSNGVESVGCAFEREPKIVQLLRVGHVNPTHVNVPIGRNVA
jgi:hypothetical protein